MDRKHEIRKEIEDFAPQLSELKKQKEGFRLPENYFDQMQQEVFEKIKTDPELQVVHKDNATIIPLKQPRFWLKVAGFALVIAAATYFFLPGNDGGNTSYLADFSADEASEYINNNLDDFELEDMLEVAQLDPVDLFPAENSQESESMEESMEQYIDDIIDDFDLDELEEML